MFGANYHLVFDFANFAKRIAYVAKVSNKNPVVLAITSLASWKRQFGGSFVFALEGESQVERRTLFPAYKANRVVEAGKAEAAAEIDKVCGRVLFICGQLQGHLIRQPAFEADDAIAAFVHTTKERSVIVSGDRDLWTLTTLPHVSVYVDNPSSSPNALVTQEMIDRSMFRRWKNMPAQYHLDASNITMFKALYGDTSDGLPTTVPRLKYPDIAPCFDVQRNLDPDAFFAWVDTAGPKVRDRVNQARTQIRIMYDVVRLRYQLPLTVEKLSGNVADFRLALKFLDAQDACKHTEVLFS